MPKIYFITGTDTGVGKTLVTAVLADYFQKQKLRIGVVKAIQTGADSDIAFVQAKAILKKEQLFCPLRLRYPLAPQQAAEVENLPPIDIKKLITAIKNFAKKFDLILVEGSGGLFVPIKYKYFMLDLIKDLRAEAVIVSRPNLGTINHTLLTIEALRKRRIKIKGIFYNQSTKLKADLSIKLNPYVITEISGLKMLGIIDYQRCGKQSGLPRYQVNWE
jgi:dethiobiotin synthetase